MQSTKEKPMTLWEIDNKLDDLQADMCILSETLTALTAALNEEILPPENLGFAFIGARDMSVRILRELELLSQNSFHAFKSIIEVAERGGCYE